MKIIVSGVLLALAKALFPPMLLVFSTIPTKSQTFPPTVLGIQLQAPTPTVLPSPTASPTPTPTLTPTPTPIPTRTPTPTPTPYPVTSEQLNSWFNTYSSKFSVDKKRLWLIAVCESNLRPNAKNGPYGGLYQYSASTWRVTRTRLNADPNPDLRFNPEEAIRTAAFSIATGNLNAWPHCSKKE